MNTITIDMIETGKNITRLSEDNGLDVRALQDILGFNNSNAIYKWKRGETLPSIDNLVILSQVFSTSIDDIIVVKSA